MDARRAQEISQSPSMITVTCNGEQVYIEHVDQDNGLATIHPLDTPSEKRSVSIDQLSEEE